MGNRQAQPARRRVIPREYRALYDAALDAGWDIVSTGGGHLRWRSPDGVTTVVTSYSPGDRRGVKNSRARLRRAGLDV